MTKTLLSILGLLLLSGIICGQTFNKKYFINTDWFSNNKDSAFYKADTIRIIKYTNFGPLWSTGGKKEYAEYEAKYLNHGDFAEFGFKKNNNCRIQ